MAEYDGGMQDETNEDLEITGFIDTGMDSTRVMVESTSTVLGFVSWQFAELAKIFREIQRIGEEKLLIEHLHVHQFHKHRSCTGHCSSEMILETLVNSTIFVASGGKFFSNKQQNTLVNLLLNEMVHVKDFDDNNRIFFHDFIFDWDDPKLPPALQQLKNNPFMPGNTLFPHDDDSYVIQFTEYLIDYLEKTNLSEYRKPKLKRRTHPCEVITWDEYYSQINDSFKEYLVI